ncbi:MAG: DUF2442 domain-containing protein [Candidatus Promineofilum sp.]|nr:DUF2442 domain-containing protein [Promineifilum sp.]MCW5864270.1 DUF2442 domain-containing protein [Anaerolineae bacterium]
MYHKLYKVVGFERQDNYTIAVWFDDGSRQVIDFEPVLHGEILGPLRDAVLFDQVAIDPIAHTLSWPNGADFDPETLRNWPDYQEELAAKAQSWVHIAAE